MWHFWAFLRIFCILNFDQGIGHQGLVSVIRVNGCTVRCNKLGQKCGILEKLVKCSVSFW